MLVSAQIALKSPNAWFLDGIKLHLDDKYEQALDCYNNALSGYKANGDITNEIEVLTHIGDAKYMLFDVMGALEAYRQAGILALSVKNEPQIISILMEQKRLCEQIGDMEQKHVVTTKIDSVVLCSADDMVRFEYNLIKGDDAKSNGDYEMAEHWYRQNDEYIGVLDDEYKGIRYHHYLLKLRDIYVKLKDCQKAQEYALLTIDECEKTSKSSYLDYLSMANVYAMCGDSINCFKCIDTALSQSLNTDNPKDIERCYVIKAGACANFQNFEKALENYKKAYGLLAKYDEDDDEKVMLLSLMASMEYQTGNYVEAEELYGKYAESVKRILGEDNMNYVEALCWLANAEGFAGHIKDACADYTNAVNILRQQVRYKLPYLTKDEREGYWETASELIHSMTPFALKANEYQTEFTKISYNGVVLEKGFLLMSELSTFELIKNKGTIEDVSDFATIASMNDRVNDLKRNTNNNVDDILQLTLKISRMEADLTSRCRAFGDITSFMDVDYDTIKAKLNEKDVLIDFTDYVSKDEGRIYAAYITKKEHEYPLLKKLIAESEIKSMRVPYPDMYYDSLYASDMVRLLWKPFEDAVDEGSTVYYVPSQMLFKIALESLPTEDGSLLGEHYHFVRLSSSRELVKFDTGLKIDMASTNTNAILYGDLLYDIENNKDVLAIRGDMLRNNGRYNKLPRSKEEVDVIEKILKSNQLTVVSYTGMIGTGESFVNMVGNAPQILHIATHGFFYTPDEAQEIDCLKGNTDAMYLSGLVMSDGMLAASNIARIDLTGVDLVVLSACKSGDGDATSEGLYGLQRAFKKAGVKTMVMSLWNVSDFVGKEFMSLFYENMFDENTYMNKRTAFEKAKLAIRTKYPEPFYWAGFVMVD